MTATVAAKGKIVFPKRVRAVHKLKVGTDFTVISRSNGDILLRPVKAKRRHKTLAGNLQALSGLNIDPERAAARNVDL